MSAVCTGNFRSRALAAALLVSISTGTLSAGPSLGLAEADVHREYGYLPLKDGIRLAYVVWRPKQKGRYPTLFKFSPYNGNGMSFSNALPYLEEGYAVAGANLRGTGCSEGAFEVNPAVDGVDGAQVVEWLAMQQWSTGRVGMIGNSYDGATQLSVAAARPPHLRAITPGDAEDSIYRTFAMIGGMFHLGIVAYWSFEGQPGHARRGAEARIGWGDTECAAIRAKQPPNSFYYEVLGHPLLDDWWEERASGTIAGQITVPTLHTGEWQDPWNIPDGQISLYKRLRPQHHMLIMQNGGHGAAQSAPERMRWLARWVKGEQNGIEHEPPVVIRWEKDGRENSGWTTKYPTWPVPGLQHLTLYMTTAGELSPDPAAQKGQPDEVRTYIYPHGSEFFSSNAAFETPPPEAGTLRYRIAPVADDMTLLGIPTLTFYFSSEQDDTDFLFVMKDIDPEGNALFLQRNYLRASLRAIDLEQSDADQVVQSYRKVEKLEPGKIYAVKVSLGAIGHVIRKGHALQVSILAPGATSDRMGAVPIGGPSINKVYHSAQYPSAVVLPILPGARAGAPAPDCGMLPSQPCRHAASGQ